MFSKVYAITCNMCPSTAFCAAPILAAGVVLAMGYMASCALKYAHGVCEILCHEIVEIFCHLMCEILRQL